jgi:hypothetical protein
MTGSFPEIWRLVSKQAAVASIVFVHVQTTLLNNLGSSNQCCCDGSVAKIDRVLKSSSRCQNIVESISHRTPALIAGGSRIGREQYPEVNTALERGQAITAATFETQCSEKPMTSDQQVLAGIVQSVENLKAVQSTDERIRKRSNQGKSVVAPNCSK